MEAQRDVVSLAKTESRRQLIRWVFARTTFFAPWKPSALQDGLALARECRHKDALFLTSLFPLGAEPSTRREAVAVFMSHAEDARCLCWAAECGAEPQRELLRRSATEGYAWAQALFGNICAVRDETMWLEKALSQDEPEAMWLLGKRLKKATNESPDLERARDLWHEAAELGHGRAQLQYAKLCPKYSLEKFLWLRRFAMQNGAVGLRRLTRPVEKQLRRCRDIPPCRMLFELGATIARSPPLQNLDWYDLDATARVAVDVYQRWRKEAELAVLCWIWLARKERVAKDIRLLIANLVWNHRTEWGETKADNDGA